ncbi:MAG TPA: hypothetical protein VHC45_08090 [Gaiellaceae bacterium]|jgi:hypothetical protein|nr:hypothetical protein [Gaiellaceae bacterium]
MTVGNEEIRDLLVEIRDLLLPIADSYRTAYERRQAIRAVLSTEKRRKAWALANGDVTQREIAKKAGMDEGGASRFFKELRELGAVGEGPNPKREIDI